jgi:hypothetical protein
MNQLDGYFALLHTKGIAPANFGRGSRMRVRIAHKPL